MAFATKHQELASLLAVGNVEIAKRRCEELLNASPEWAEGSRFLALIEMRLGNDRAAVAAIRRALDRNPDDAEAHNIYGVLLARQMRFVEALAAFAEACARRPDFVQAIGNLGNALFDAGRFAEALEAFDRAGALAPSNADVAVSRGRTLHALGRVQQALEEFTRATQLDPRLVDAHLGRAEMLRLCDLNTEALNVLAGVLAIDATNKLALQNSAALLHKTGELGLAAERFEALVTLLRLEPRYVQQLEYALGMAVSCRRSMCAWSDLRTMEAELLDHIRYGRAHVSPHLSFMLADDADIQALCAHRYFGAQLGAQPPTQLQKKRQHARLRLGYLSGDFREHPTSWLLAGVIEEHDRKRFEVHGFSSGPDDHSSMRARLVGAFDAFTDISSMDDAQAAAQIADREIDVLIDLSGPMTFGRPGVVARRPAPLSVHFLGNPGPPGNYAIDYFIADEITAPLGHEAYLGCAVAKLPPSCVPVDRMREFDATSAEREAYGLPDKGVVFCGFCQSVKLSPDVFDVWMRILLRSADSVLWLLEDNRFIRSNLGREARLRGVDPARLIFAGRVGQRAHMARHRHADLFLDTWPCGAHTTAVNALSLNVPVISMPGRTFASRVGASLLTAAELPELIVDGVEAYENLAVAIATSPARLASLKETLATTRLKSALFDRSRYRVNLENAYCEMWRRYCTGIPAQTFKVEN